ncbi:MAG: RNA-directed DNA polymerase [Deltaproteobacteria bacterium]|nr:RNA-directed DNA polymerase [Deltaproteobacteria bacterium]
MAYLKARKGKRWQRKIQDFEKNLDDNIDRIRKGLIDKSFHTSEYKRKRIYEPKEREIFILPFAPDRIVQHALMNIIEPIWDKLMIYHSYACRVGKGIHAGSKKTMEYVRRNKYCLKCDISKFYPSVDHDILYEILLRKLKCADTLWLIKNIIYSHPDGKNIPIGNYTSQWFGNIYLNELDTHVKHELKCKDYIRYCDDFCLFHNDKTVLGAAAKNIEMFLLKRLKLKMSKCDLFPVSHGVDFLGYRHFRKYILLRKSTAKRVKKRLAKLPCMLEEGKINSEQFRSSVASTWGWLKWANTYNFQLAVKMNNLQEMVNAT